MGSSEDYKPLESLTLASTPFFIAIDKEDEAAFEKYCELRIAHRTNAMMGIVFVLVTSYMYLMSVMSDGGLFVTIVVAIGGLVLNPMLIFVIFCQFKTRNGLLSLICKTVVPSAPFIMSYLAVGHSVVLGLYLVARVLNGKCRNLEQFNRWNCNSEYDAHALPQSHLIILMLLPFLFSIALKTVRAPYVFVSWLVVIVTVVISLVWASSYYSSPLVIFYVPLSLTCIAEIHRQNVYQFLLLKKQQLLMDNNRRLAEEAQSELRFMIANMAHDLKTVS